MALARTWCVDHGHRLKDVVTHVPKHRDRRCWVPLWDIADTSGDQTNLLVTNRPQGEIATRAAGYQPWSVETWRAWEYWAPRADAVIG